MASCNAENPMMPGVRCEVDSGQRHVWHSCRNPDVAWENTEVRREQERRRGTPYSESRDRLLGYARATDANARAIANDRSRIDTPHAFLRREPHDTEVAAARFVLPRSGTQRRLVYDHIVQAGEHGATDEEIQQALGLHHNSQTPRRLELVQAGLIEDSGRRRTGHSTVPSIVWVATPRE